MTHDEIEGEATPLEDVVRDATQWQERGADLVIEVLAREGPTRIVETVAKLVATRAPGHGDALRFLADGVDVPQLDADITTNLDLRVALEGLLASPDLRDRRRAIGALSTLPVAGRSEMLEAAAQTTRTEGDLIALAEILALRQVPAIITELLASDDWLLRWALLPWANARAHDAPLADQARAQLAADPNPLIAGEVAQHRAILEAFAARVAATPNGWTFGVLSNYGPAPSFRDLTARFVAEWPPEKSRYTLEELRAFVVRETT